MDVAGSEFGVDHPSTCVNKFDINYKTASLLLRAGSADAASLGGFVQTVGHLEIHPQLRRRFQPIGQIGLRRANPSLVVCEFVQAGRHCRASLHGSSFWTTSKL